MVVRQRGFRCLAKHWQVPASPATTVPGTPITPKESDDLVKKLQAENARLRELKMPTFGDAPILACGFRFQGRSSQALRRSMTL